MTHSCVIGWNSLSMNEAFLLENLYPTRYFVRNGGTAQWSDSREELEEIYGKGEDSGILSFKFIPGNIYDNPPAMKANPGYVSFLKAQPRVEMERLLLGSWYARVEAAGILKRMGVEVDFQML